MSVLGLPSAREFFSLVSLDFVLGAFCKGKMKGTITEREKKKKFRSFERLTFFGFVYVLLVASLFEGMRRKQDLVASL